MRPALEVQHKKGKRKCINRESNPSPSLISTWEAMMITATLLMLINLNQKILNCPIYQPAAGKFLFTIKLLESLSSTLSSLPSRSVQCKFFIFWLFTLDFLPSRLSEPVAVNWCGAKRTHVPLLQFLNSPAPSRSRDRERYFCRTDYFVDYTYTARRLRFEEDKHGAVDTPILSILHQPILNDLQSTAPHYPRLPYYQQHHRPTCSLCDFSENVGWGRSVYLFFSFS
jgi:hypothetical protein